MQLRLSRFITEREKRGSGEKGQRLPSESESSRSFFPFLLFPLSRLLRKWLPVLLFLVATAAIAGELRFPPPEFESGHVMPTMQHPLPRSVWMEYFDVLVLAATLGVATWLVFKQRSRKALFWLSVFAVLYFGFYREGCVCAIGSIQNVALGLGNNGYALPGAVIAFFALPLAVALFFGRTFCAAVCPHGALQDLLLIKPLSLPRWLERGLATIPFLYLGLAVLFAATGSTFIICRYDPFIPIFRLSGSFFSLILAGAFVVAALFIGRPYCRFLCPYGALLKLAAAVSRWHVRITPDVCKSCKLCAESCPFDVIPVPGPNAVTPKNLKAERVRLAMLIALVPVLIAAGAIAGVRFGEWASKVNPDVRLAAQYVALQSGQRIEMSEKPEELAMLRAERVASELLPAAQTSLRRFRIGGAIFGAWVGLVIGARLLVFATARRHHEFEPERTGCFACARCFSYCPQERLRVKRLNKPAGAGATTTAQPV